MPFQTSTRKQLDCVLSLPCICQHQPITISNYFSRCKYRLIKIANINQILWFIKYELAIQLLFQIYHNVRKSRVTINVLPQFRLTSYTCLEQYLDFLIVEHTMVEFSLMWASTGPKEIESKVPYISIFPPKLCNIHLMHIKC
jgi:hypothetical protein